jgi:sugar phosphate isomerase/epimerase
MAGERGLLTTIEFAPAQQVATLADALAVIAFVGRTDFKLLIDAMHFFRSGGSVDQIAALDPALIGYAQLCDVPLVPVEHDYMKEAMFQRMAPGQGELPLAAFVAALPRDIPIGLEVPMLAAAEAGTMQIAVLRPAVEAARRLLEQMGETRC